MTHQIQTPNLLIVAAVKEEIGILADIMANLTCSHLAGKPLLCGELKEIPTRIIVTGPGVVNTAIGLTATIEQQRPDMIIQTGCAGIFRETGATIGDIGIADCEIDIHTGIEPETNASCIPPVPLPFPLIDVDDMGITGRFPVDTSLRDSAFRYLNEALSDRNISVVHGPFVTVSTITATDRRAKQLATTYSPCMESMEGASAAQVALVYGIPFLEIRSASNHVGKRDKTAWNLPLAFDNSNRAVLEYINHIRNEL